MNTYEPTATFKNITNTIEGPWLSFIILYFLHSQNYYPEFGIYYSYTFSSFTCVH